MCHHAQLNIKPLQNPILVSMSWTGVKSLMTANRPVVHPSQAAKICMAKVEINILTDYLRA
jgi:hypothetical protein